VAGKMVTGQAPGARGSGAALAGRSASRVDLRGLTITTAIAVAAHDKLAALEVGDEIELLVDRFPALVADLQAWCRATGHELVELAEDGESRCVTVRKGDAHLNVERVAIVVSHDGLEELLSPLGFALAAALSGAHVSVYLQGPAVRVLTPGFQPRLRGLARPFSRFARSGLEKAGHVAAAEKLQQLQKLGGQLYVCGPSLDHFRVDPATLAFEQVIVCEYLTFMEVMQQSTVQLYA